MELRPDLPSPSAVDAELPPDNDQANSLGRLVNLPSIERSANTISPAAEQPVLSEGQLQVLGCIACIANKGENAALNAGRIATQCTGRNNSFVRHTVNRLADLGMVVARDRDSATVRRRESRQLHELTEAGIQALPPDWQKCTKIESLASPLASLSPRQRQFMRCVSCLINQGEEVLNTTIAECRNEVPNNITPTMQKFVQEGLLTVHHIDKPGIRESSKRRAYKPSDTLLPHLPKAPLPAECTFNAAKTERTIAALTPGQQRMLSCIACIASRTTFELGVSKAAVEDCTGQSITTTFSNSEKLAACDLVTVHPQAFQGRTYYELHAEGKKAAQALPSLEDCKRLENIEPVDKDKMVKRCLACIWGRQLGTNHEPAATVGMISDCTGFSAINVRKRLTRLAASGELEQITVEQDELRNLHRPTIAFTPGGKLLPLATSDTCGIDLYPPVPPGYLKPAIFDKLPRLEKSSSADKLTVRSLIKNKSNHPLLSKEQEWELATIIQNTADEAERERAVATFVEHNVKLALWYAANRSSFESLFLSFEDRVQEALIGLEKAARYFNPEFETRFSSYALYWAKQHIQRAAAAQAEIPINTFIRIPTTYYAATNFEAKHGRPPTVLELSLACKTTPKIIMSVLEARDDLSQRALSLDHIITSPDGKGRRFGDDTTLHDVTGFVQADLEHVDMSGALRAILPYLADYEKATLSNILGFSKITRDDAAAMFGVSHVTISSARTRVESLLRHPYFGIAPAYDTAKEWQHDAACATTNNDGVVKRTNGHAIVPTDIKWLCNSCPVRKECFEETLRGEKPVSAGIWAGYNTKELRAYYKRSRSARVTEKSGPATSIAQS